MWLRTICVYLGRGGTKQATRPKSSKTINNNDAAATAAYDGNKNEIKKIKTFNIGGKTTHK